MAYLACTFSMTRAQFVGFWTTIEYLRSDNIHCMLYEMSMTWLTWGLLRMSCCPGWAGPWWCSLCPQTRTRWSPKKWSKSKTWSIRESLHYIFILMTKVKRRVLLEVNKYIIIYSNEFSNIACGKQTIFIMVAIVTLLLTHIVPVLHIYVIFSEPMLLELLFTRVINSWFLLLGMTPERKESSRKTAGQWHHNLH